MIDLRPEHLETVKRILAAHVPECEVRAFGSRVTWTAKDYSDLDLVVVGKERLDPQCLSRLTEALENSDLPIRVDVLDWHAISEKFRKVIEKQFEVVRKGEKKSRDMAGDIARKQTIPKGWRRTTWGAELSLEYGKALRGYDEVTGPFRVYGANGPIGWTTQPLAPGPGVILGRKGAYRGVHYSVDPFFVIDTAYYVVPKTALHMRWLYYAIRHYKLGEINDGSPIPSTTRAAVYVMSLEVPSLAEQKAIAGVLGALDDKIESNRRTSQALERVARAIFRAWFVDFEPVKAKAAGARSFPGMPQETFDALPACLVESELGPVPEGWEVGCIGDLVSVRGGGTPSTKVEEYWEGGTHCWLTPKDLSGMKDPILLSTDRMITDKGLDKISSGLLPVGTVLLSSRAPVGYLVLSEVPTAINQGFIAMVCDGPLPPLYVFHWTQSVMDEIKSRASGTTFPEISKTAFRPIKVCVPTKPVLESFTAVVEPPFEKLTANIRESQSLEKLRDYLLPKLLSGKVRVTEESVISILEPTAAARERRPGHE